MIKFNSRVRVELNVDFLQELFSIKKNSPRQLCDLRPDSYRDGFTAFGFYRSDP
jgi:hypothetical protein